MSTSSFPRDIVFWICLFLISGLQGCRAQTAPAGDRSEEGAPLYHNDEIRVGAERMEEYLPLLAGKSVGLVVNQTSMVGPSHLADTLISLDVRFKYIFAPEHGFRGTADAGETVKDGTDIRTGTPIISLYGANKKPTPEQLEGIDVILFDIQDVGARFYTFISTMSNAMEAAAEKGIPFIVLDRPNPNGHYVAGPVLDPSYSTFVGLHQVPVVHGMTIGEYALMVNGEGWLANGVRCDLTVIPCTGYDHSKFYALPVKPSPNLPNMTSIYLYPALCLFEGTVISVGRGTDKQFQVLGSPDLIRERTDVSFTPEPNIGAKYPKLQGIECFGWDYSDADIREIRTGNLAPEIYRKVFDCYTGDADFFTDYFDKLAGGTALREAILSGAGPEALQGIYSEGVADFLPVRARYLLYPDARLGQED